MLKYSVFIYDFNRILSFSVDKDLFIVYDTKNFQQE